MKKEKQIEEMAKIMLEASTSANVEPVLEMEGKEVVLGENATKILNNILEQAFIPFLAETLYTAGYRKASEVAREIFAIIDDIVESWKLETRSKETGELIRTSYNGTMIAKCIAELKKKFTEEEKK